MGPARQIWLPCIVALVLFPSITASAQDWKEPWADSYDRPPRVDVSGSAGVLAPTDWSNLLLLGSIFSVSRILGQGGGRDGRLKPATVYGGHGTYLPGGDVMSPP